MVSKKKQPFYPVFFNERHAALLTPRQSGFPEDYRSMIGLGLLFPLPNLFTIVAHPVTHRPANKCCASVRILIFVEEDRGYFFIVFPGHFSQHKHYYYLLLIKGITHTQISNLAHTHRENKGRGYVNKDSLSAVL